MNRFAFVALMALACAAAGPARANEYEGEEDSQLSLQTTDDEEVSRLTGKLKAFEPFCLDSRSYIIADLRDNADQGAASAFKLFFDSAEAMGRETLEVSKTANQRLTKQIADPDADIEEPANEAEEIIARGQENIRSAQIQPKAFIEGLKAAISSVSATVGAQFEARINSLKQRFNIDQLGEGFEVACAKVGEYEIAMQKQFNEFKGQLAKSDASYAKLELNQVPCVTSTRVRSIDGFCSLVRNVKKPIMQIFPTFSHRT